MSGVVSKNTKGKVGITEIREMRGRCDKSWNRVNDTQFRRKGARQDKSERIMNLQKKDLIEDKIQS